MVIRVLKENSIRYVCYPLEKNVGPPHEAIKRHPDWKYIKCPICGAPCYDSDLAREAIATGAEAACTSCALTLTGALE